VSFLRVQSLIAAVCTWSSEAAGHFDDIVFDLFSTFIDFLPALRFSLCCQGLGINNVTPF